MAKLQAEQTEKDARLAAKDAELARTIEEIAALKAKIQEYKERNSQTPDDHDYSEAETRDYLIDLLLKESGWDLKPRMCWSKGGQWEIVAGRVGCTTPA